MLALALLAGTFIGWSCHQRSGEPSVLITDAELMTKFGREELPKNYRVMARVTRWNLDDVQGRFERSFACTVAEMENATVDPRIVSDRFEAWLAKLVKVTSAVADTNSPAAVGRVILYEAEQTAGELRYTIKPVPNATLTVNGKQSPANFQSLDIQIVEQRKHK